MGKLWKQWLTLFLGSQITADGDCSHEIQRKLKDAYSWEGKEIERRLLLGSKVMTNLDSILKSRDITLPTKVGLVKAVVFSVVMDGCESWTIKKAECWRFDTFELWCSKEDSWESLGLQGDPTSPSQRKSVLGVHWKDWYWSWNPSTLASWCEELTHLKRPWCWGRLKVGGEGSTENEMVGWHHWLNRHGFGWTPRVGDGQGGLAYSGSWGHK